MKTIAVILLSLFSLTQTPVGQLMKLPVLVEHFYKHQLEDGVSLFKFLSDHYGSNHNDNDQAEDERLPFKTVIFQPIGFAVLPALEKPDFSYEFDIPTKLMLPDFYTPQQHLSKIFHPPRV